jgi:deoxyribose-phosphate aldolase
MELSKYIEHTLLSPTCTSAQITKLCEEAIQYNFKGVCIPPFYIRHAANILENTPVQIVTVIGFPMGYSAIAAKIEEIKRSVDEGVNELDIVANICAVKDGKWSHVQNDLDSAVRATHLHGKIAKIIIESGLLTNEEIQKITNIAVELGADFVKTSTGFHNAPATLAHIQTIKNAASSQIKIKASGGIRTREQAIQFIQAGATRLGTSASIEIVNPSFKAEK